MSELPVKNIILFWEASLLSHRLLMAETSVTMVEETIKILKRVETECPSWNITIQ
jgi:hypothetical protein